MTGSRSSGTSSSSITLPPGTSWRAARGDGVAARVTRLRNPCRAAIHPADRLRADPPTRRSTTLSSRSDLFRTLARTSASSSPTARWARCCRPHDPDRRRLRGPRGLQRDPQRHPARRRPRRPRRLLRGRASTASRPTPSAPTSPTSASTTSPTGSTSWPQAGARIARESADGWSTADQPRCVLGSVGPGTKLPSLGHAPFAVLRDAYAEQAPRHGRRRRRRHPRRDRAGPAAGQGRRHRRASGRWPTPARTCPVIVQVTVETTGTMLLGSRDRRRADRAGAARHRRDRAQLRHRPGRDERAPAPPRPARPRRRRLHAQRRPAAAHHATARATRSPPRSSPPRTTQFTREFGLVAGRRLLRHDAGAPAPRSSSASAAGRSQPRRPRPERGRRLASTSTCRSARTPSYLSIGERTNANGSKAFREAMLEPRWDDCVEIARDQTRDGAHLLDVCVDYVGRDGAADMREVVGRFATASHPAAGARLDRARRDRGRARAARRPRRRQLGQLRGRRRARRRGSPGSCRSSASTAPPSSP